ncbi:MAG: STAS domain-containing protein [Nocardioides sp.]
MTDLQVAVREREGVAVIDLIGDVNGAAGDALDRAYAEAVGLEGEAAIASVALNFEQTEFINSTGIALIVSLLAQARRQRVEVRAFGLSDHYREIFEITRLSDFMTIADDEDRAINDGRKEQP